MNINIIGVPLTYGCGKDGAQEGPITLRMEGIVKLAKEAGHEVYDVGNTYVPELKDEDKYKWHDHLKFLQPLVEVNANLAEQVHNSLKGGNFPLIVGGDHSLGIGSVAGASAHHNDLDNYAVIWIDAHGDINTPESSPSGNIHGMPLAISMNEGHEDLTSVYFDGMKVKPENVYIIAARDLDDGEYVLADKVGLHMYEMKDVREKGVKETVEEVIEKVKASGVENVHLSFDIDAMDASLVPATGTPVDGGFNMEEGKYVLSTFLKEGFVKSMDFVELNPTLVEDPDLTVKNCMELLETVFNSIEKK